MSLSDVLWIVSRFRRKNWGPNNFCFGLIKAAASLRVWQRILRLSLNWQGGISRNKYADTQSLPSVTESKAANCVDCRCSQNGLLESRLSIRKAEEGDVIDVEPPVIASARPAGLTTSETADLLAFLQPAISRFYWEWPPKMRDISSEQQFFGPECVVDVRIQRQTSKH